MNIAPRGSCTRFSIGLRWADSRGGWSSYPTKTSTSVRVLNLLDDLEYKQKIFTMQLLLVIFVLPSSKSSLGSLPTTASSPLVV
jgi:hypothetical protein